MKTQNLQEKINKAWDTENWKKEVAERSSLKLYNKFKEEIKEEKFYDNHQKYYIRQGLTTLT